jgi:hypothetical protein
MCVSVMQGSCKFVLLHMCMGMLIHKSQINRKHAVNKKSIAHSASCCFKRFACAIGIASATIAHCVFMKPCLHTRQI